jgi:tubulin polyglutamylase TTLL1
MYGFDILLDSVLKPWLIEINASPSLSTTTKTDKDLKLNLINDVYRIVLPDDSNDSETQKSKHITQLISIDLNRVGGFSVLFDETQDPNPKKSIAKRNNLKIWK